MGLKPRAKGAPANFWEDSSYARKTYVSKPPTVALIGELESELGYRLPRSYIELMRTQNGGIPRDACFPATGTSWDETHVAITGIHGIGRERRYSLGGEFGSKFWLQMWNYPDIGICICSCPSGGHDMIMLDYRACGPDGEPAVAHVDQGADFKITPLADNFEAFIAGLQNESVYDTSAEDLKDNLAIIEHGAFSSVLTELVAGFDELDVAAIMRSLCRRLAEEKGYFALHADPASHLIYDLQFLLFSHSREVSEETTFLDAYPSILALGDGAFSTGGYAPDFVKAWLDARVAAGAIERRGQQLVFSPAAKASLLARLAPS